MIVFFGILATLFALLMMGTKEEPQETAYTIGLAVMIAAMVITKCIH